MSYELPNNEAPIANLENLLDFKKKQEDNFTNHGGIPSKPLPVSKELFKLLKDRGQDVSGLEVNDPETQERNKKIEENNRTLTNEEVDKFSQGLLEIRKSVTTRLSLAVSGSQEKKIIAEGFNQERQYMKENGFNILHDRMIPWVWENNNENTSNPYDSVDRVESSLGLL